MGSVQLDFMRCCNYTINCIERIEVGQGTVKLNMKIDVGEWNCYILEKFVQFSITFLCDATKMKRI